MKKVTTKFKVNKEKRTVVCVIETQGDLFDRVRKSGLDYNFKNYDFDCTYVGIAKCAPEDEWDEKLGKQIAEYRAMLKRKRDIDKKISRILKESIDKLENLNKHQRIKEPSNPLRLR